MGGSSPSGLGSRSISQAKACSTEPRRPEAAGLGPTADDRCRKRETLERPQCEDQRLAPDTSKQLRSRCYPFGDLTTADAPTATIRRPRLA